MECGPDEQLAHLRRLADELGQRGLAAELSGPSRASLRAANPEIPQLTEQVLCAQARDGSWCYWWPWGQPIGSVHDVAQAVAKIAAVLRPAEGDG